MTVRVLYFAALRELVGLSEEAIDLETATQTLSDLLAFLSERHPALRGRLSSVRVAQNEAFADLDSRIADGDVIALVPPVAGG